MAGGSTVFALSSAAGRAAIAVVRISGPRAGAALTALGGRTDRARLARLARLKCPHSGAALDDALTLWFPAPASETGEDVAELHVHGGPSVIAGVLEALGRIEGLEPAGPGDFTRRAFLNGKLDLTAVEGLADLIAAETEAQRLQALDQLGGGLARLYEGWRAQLVGALAHVEAAIDFADEEVPDDVIGRALGEAAGLGSQIARHLADGRRGERLRDGFRVVIAGPPNAGKSSLLNALAGREAAIVAHQPGTTRDVIDVALDLKGLPVLVSDTAGLRRGAGAVEREGIRRAEARMAAADLVVWLRDGARTAAPGAPAGLDGKVIELWSKADLGRAPAGAERVSVESGEGIDGLVERIAERAAAGTAGAGPALTRSRHRHALEAAAAALERAERLEKKDAELVAEELRSAAHALGRVTGRVDVEELLGAIFSEFCIGK
jgi:tRNA modification GTPase